MGIYSSYTESSTGGVMYGRYGGSTTVSYGSYGFFEMAAALILLYLLTYVFSRLLKKDK